MRSFILFSLCFTLLNSFAGEVYTDPQTGISVLSAELELPSEGNWYLSDASLFTETLGYGYVEAPEDHYERAAGERTLALQVRRQLSARENLFWNLRYALGFSYNQDPEKRSPASIDDIDFEKNRRAKKTLEQGIIAFIPNVILDAKKDTDPQLLMVELKPQVNDGKHFVYYNSRKLERIEINSELMASMGLTITLPPQSEQKETVTYTLNIRVLDPAVQSVTVSLNNKLLDKEEVFTIPIDGKTLDRENFAEWAEYRAYNWWSEQSRLSQMWNRQVKDLYQLEAFDWDDSEAFDPRGQETNIMGVLGGDAAIRETLQLQNLTAGTSAVEDKNLIPITDVKGVTVRAHDYEELLDGKPGGQLAIANLCPSDRLFAWFPKPEGLLQLLDGSGNVMSRLGSNRSSLILDHQILQKHMAKLGLSEDQLKLILQSGMVGESAVLLPDLFLSEGTDVTSITKINNMAALSPMLKAMGISLTGSISELPTPAGRTAFVMIKDDYLMFSSNAEELNLLKHVALGTTSNLGESAEFRYMLTQNSPTEHTAAYVYMSDPFIRRLTGPALKIAQMRRLQAKAEMEALSAGDLLYRMDHRKEAPDLQTLIDEGYAPAPTDLQNLVWANAIATNATWGTAANLNSLSSLLPSEVTMVEKGAYDQYRNRYQRFWRQFFDPIAIRVDLKPEQEVETTIFILPLINSSIYDQVRGIFRNQPGTPPMQRPVIEPAPIAMMSINLSEELWIEFLDGVSEVVEDQLGMNLPIWEQLGPGLHFGLADSNSVITFGSGELMGLFSAGSNMFNDEMLLLPLIGSLLTRPVVMAIDLQDPEASRRAMRSMETGVLMQENGFLDLHVNLIQITGADRWLLRIQVGDVLFFTLSMEIQDRYLVFSNLPLNYHPRVIGSENTQIKDASLLLQPGAINETGPGFKASALDQAREQSLAGLDVLNMYYMAGFTSLEDAMAESKRLFGYVPVHPAPGEFIWTEHGPRSSIFGGIYDSQQPPLDQVDTTGLLPQTERVEVSMQLENEGLRTRLTWKGKQK
ncbi:hypothetical protein P3T73_15715 [Kiritimatiellota bacterium B12222]|nr:hypothetical protein P3T73_15715 [Kiritimatiellota bacterium B12222]